MIGPRSGETTRGSTRIRKYGWNLLNRVRMLNLYLESTIGCLRGEGLCVLADR